MNNIFNIDNGFFEDGDLPAEEQHPFEEKLNLYVDGELGLEQQAPLFSHLAVCAQCRQQLDSVLHFRRLSRQETISVPPGVDDVFLKRLQKQKGLGNQIDRAADRRPLWQSKRTVSLRGGIILAASIFIAGLLYPTSTVSDPLTRGIVIGQDESVEFTDSELMEGKRNTVYVFYPGLTVEASHIEGQH